MKDRIKFNDVMLKAVINGRKTQTRRPIEPQPKVTEDMGYAILAHGKMVTHYQRKYAQHIGMDLLMLIARTVRLATLSTLQTRTVISKEKLKLLIFGCNRFRKYHSKTQ